MAITPGQFYQPTVSERAGGTALGTIAQGISPIYERGVERQRTGTRYEQQQQEYKRLQGMLKNKKKAKTSILAALEGTLEGQKTMELPLLKDIGIEGLKAFDLDKIIDTIATAKDKETRRISGKAKTEREIKETERKADLEERGMKVKERPPKPIAPKSWQVETATEISKRQRTDIMKIAQIIEREEKSRPKITRYEQEGKAAGETIPGLEEREEEIEVSKERVDKYKMMEAYVTDEGLTFIEAKKKAEEKFERQREAREKRRLGREQMLRMPGVTRSTATPFTEQQISGVAPSTITAKIDATGGATGNATQLKSGTTESGVRFKRIR